MKYFDASEFICKCGRAECDALKKISPVLEQKLDALRARLHRPLVVTSGLRCEYWNAKVGGVLPSAHVSGTAVDLACSTSRERFELASAALAVGFLRFGVKKGMFHVDVSAQHPQYVFWLYD